MFAPLFPVFYGGSSGRLDLRAARHTTSLLVKAEESQSDTQDATFRHETPVELVNTHSYTHNYSATPALSYLTTCESPNTVFCEHSGALLDGCCCQQSRWCCCYLSHSVGLILTREQPR